MREKLRELGELDMGILERKRPEPSERRRCAGHTVMANVARRASLRQAISAVRFSGGRRDGGKHLPGRRWESAAGTTGADEADAADKADNADKGDDANKVEEGKEAPGRQIGKAASVMMSARAFEQRGGGRCRICICW
jgi:hypothetical protein